jgi:HEAT repeat protein
LALGAVGCSSFEGFLAGTSSQGRGGGLPDVPSPAERIAALRQLARQGTSSDAARSQELAQGLAESIRGEEDPAIRAEIVRTLAAYPGEASDGVLRSAVKDPDMGVRVAACEVWGRRGNAEAVALLSGALDADPDTDVRLAAARALGQSNSPEAVAVLGQALDDRDPAIQYRSMLSLEQATGKDLGGNVGRWRQYVAAGLPESGEPPSLAERLHGLLRF